MSTLSVRLPLASALPLPDRPNCDIDAYRASKTLAEKAAWAFLEEHTVDGKAPFAISTINPPLVFGPIIHQCESAKSLNTYVLWSTPTEF